MKSRAWRKVGGEEEDRTPDLCIANAALSQLSYPPIDKKSNNKSDAQPSFFVGCQRRIVVATGQAWLWRFTAWIVRMKELNQAMQA